MQPATLGQLLIQKKSHNSTGITFIEGSNQEEFLSYEALYHSAHKALSFLQQKGMEPGNELVFQVSDNKNFIIVFWACILGGIIPVPLSIGQNDEHRQKLFNIWPVLHKPYLVISAANLPQVNAFAKSKNLEDAFAQFEPNIIDEASVMSSQTKGNIYEANENDIAFIQFSSGSTGSPKGVVLTHKNLITNISDISKAAAYTPADSMISWMPLTHDMGLIGFHLNPLLVGMQQYLIPTAVFVRNPALWPEKASAYKATVLCSPNFGYKYLLRHCDASGGYDWDLSNVRILYNGAEPISVKLCNEFLESYSRYGLKFNAMCPVYGLAEASLAVSISGLTDEVISIAIDRNKLNAGHKIAVNADAHDLVSFVNVGNAIEHCSLRITDSENIAVAEETIGHVQIKGDNVTTGYYNNETETKKVITNDGWLRTGDLGFIKNGSLYITGRAKDIFFINGQNYYPHDIERVAEEVDGIELNKIAVAGFFNEETQKEETIAFVFHRASTEKFVPVVRSLKKLINSRVGFELDRVVPVKDIPKTTSGKLQRFRLLQQFREGVFANVELELAALMNEPEATGLAAPANEQEQKLLEIWQNILKLDSIGVTQSFFELGGNSLNAAEMTMMLLKDLHVDISVELIYEKSTIRQLAGEIAIAEKTQYAPIELTAENDHYPVTSSQKRIYYSWELNKTSIAYNIPVAFKLVGRADAVKLEHCLRQLVQRHDLLRSFFHIKEGPVFSVHNAVELALQCIECTSAELDNTLQSLVQPFDLSIAPLCRASLVTLQENEHVLLLDFHHIISDGKSIYNFVSELLDLYSGKALPLLPAQYKDIACREQQELTSEKIKAQQAYWLEQLQGELPLLELPANGPRPFIFDTEGEKIEFVLDEATTAKLHALAKANNCTLHVLMFTIYNTLLSKYTGQEEIIIGIPASGRRHPDMQQMQGMFVNNLAIRSTIRGHETFTQLLELLKRQIASALENQDYPFHEVVNALNKKRDVSRNPVFDTMFVYQNMGVPRAANTGFTLSRYFFDPGFAKFDLSMEVFDHERSIKYAFEYARKLFSRETIEGMARHFENLVHRILEKPASRLTELAVISETEFTEYIHNYNATKRSYPSDKIIHQLFEAQVAETPHNTALEFNHETLTYAQLNDKANKLAFLLREKGIAPNSVAGVLLQRSPQLIISILGILKAGGCYVPIDTGLPTERIRYIINNSQCKVVITGDAHFDLQHELNHPGLLFLNIDTLQLDATETIPVPHISTPNHLAYIIYTSGTTGNPKGVMIRHQSLVNYITWGATHYAGNEKADFALYTSISFDLTITSIFTPLITGNSIVIYAEDESSLLIDRVIAENKVDVVKLTPSHLKIIAENRLPVPGRIKRFIAGGEQLETRLAKEIHALFNGNIEIYNEYGPTEATVGCMIHKYNPAETHAFVPVGIPAANTQLYVLDKFLQPVPLGVHGEMYISGDGLAAGYLFNEALTNEKFIQNPFLPAQRMYKTGDIAKRLPGGILAFIGRTDNQVKLNGYRIELPEIAHQLLLCNGIAQALITVKNNKKGQPVICAYYKSTEELEASVLRNHLAARLPHYMIPVHFVSVNEIPLTKNGKADHSALPDPETNKGGSAPSLPTNEVEELSLKIWQEVLGEKDLSVTDNFFELGGDSIKAVQITSRLNEKGVSLNSRDILTYHTIEQISLRARMDDAKNGYEQGIAAGEKPLTPIESWFFAQQFKNPNYFNQSVLLNLNRELNIDLLEEAFNKLIAHHDGLRMNYDASKKRMFYNNAHLASRFSIAEYATGVSDLVTICEQVRNSFDIANSLLLKAAIIREDGAKMLFITAHHLVTDGVSWRILLEDLYNVYTALENKAPARLPRKTATLINWWEKLAEYSATDEAYWKETENTAFAVPLDVETSNWKAGNLNKISGRLDKENTRFLVKDAHETYKTDVPVLLNTALALTLREWTGRNELVVEQENHGRHLQGIDTSRTTGWFTAMFPIKLEVKDTTTGNQVKGIKEQLRKVPGHGLGYGLYKYGNSNGCAAPAGIRFNYLGQFDKELNNELFGFSSRPTGSETDPENTMTARLELNSMIIDGELILEINYNKEAHTALGINRLMAGFFNNLRKILDHIREENNVYFTPSDFEAVDLNQEELDALFQ